MIEWLNVPLLVLGTIGAWLLLMLIGFGIFMGAYAPYYWITRKHASAAQGASVPRKLAGSLIGAISLVSLGALFLPSLKAVNDVRINHDRACIEGEN